ncbi:MAG: CoA-binding protein, partial [Betaproteobacteria bacterium]|nr:CoA-binding protein [Betaproteobacteria bacterium]
MDSGRSSPQLKAFFAPASAALVGATEDQAKFGGRLFRSMLDFGFRGPIFPVNPNRKRVFGLECYP